MTTTDIDTNNNRMLEEIAAQMAVELAVKREQRMGMFAAVRELKRKLRKVNETKA